MKVVAIENYKDKLTLGKTYKVIYGYMGEYLIINDNGEKGWYNFDKFISIEEHRISQILKLIEE